MKYTILAWYPLSCPPVASRQYPDTSNLTPSNDIVYVTDALARSFHFVPSNLHAGGSGAGGGGGGFGQHEVPLAPPCAQQGDFLQLSGLGLRSSSSSSSVQQQRCAASLSHLASVKHFESSSGTTASSRTMKEPLDLTPANEATLFSATAACCLPNAVAGPLRNPGVAGAGGGAVWWWWWWWEIPAPLLNIRSVLRVHSQKSQFTSALHTVSLACLQNADEAGAALGLGIQPQSSGMCVGDGVGGGFAPQPRADVPDSFATLFSLSAAEVHAP